MADYAPAKTSVLAKAVQPITPPEVPESSRVSVHAAVSRFSVLYERIRNAVDYKDDHLLRKAAINRILKRQLALESDPIVIGGHLVRELIAARYLPNGQVHEEMGDKVGTVIRKYLACRRVNAGSEAYAEWLLGIISAELEELLDDHTESKAFVNFLFEQLCERITVRDNLLDDTERRLQVYVACHRLLEKADDEMVGFKLVRAFQAEWMKPETWTDSPTEMALTMVETEKRVRGVLTHHFSNKFLSAVKPWSISLNILRAALHEDPPKAAALMADPIKLHAAVERIADRRIKDSKSKLRRGTIRAIIYLFITKMIFALVMEVPAERLIYGTIHQLPLAINVFFPPVLMFLVGLMIRPPAKENIERIKRGVDELLSPEGPKGREIRIARKRGWLGALLFTLAYLFTFLVSFGLVYLFLMALQFTWVSSLIFIFFLCVVSFFAFRLRNASREFVAVERPDNIGTIIADFFSLPVLRVGRLLSETLSRFNVFIFFFDFIIEAPFKIFLNLLEEWSAFMKEKKEQLQ